MTTKKNAKIAADLITDKDLDVAAPVLVQLAEQLEKALPFMAAAPASVNLELTLDGTAMDLQDLSNALANLREAFITANAGAPSAAEAC